MPMIVLVIWMSACDGVGSPEGWLCINLLAIEKQRYFNILFLVRDEVVPVTGICNPR
jgi:hypothetical protein